MRIAQTRGPSDVAILTVPPPVLHTGDARVEVADVGLCGSDYHLFNGSHPYAKYPQTQGHEYSGYVRELPEDYQGPLSVGEPVLGVPFRPCGQCFACRRGRNNCCVDLKVMGAHIPGALAQEIAVPVSSLYSASGLDMELAALVEPIAIGYQTVVRGGLKQDDNVLILGAGPIGLAATLAASDLGANIMVADRLAPRLDVARAMGAAQTTNTAEGDLADRVAEFTRGDGPAVVIDATGVPALIQQAFDLVAYSGSIVVVGISDRQVEIPVIEFTKKEVSVFGSRNSNSDTVFPLALDLVRRHREQLRSWITHRVRLDELPDMLAFAVSHPEQVEKVLVKVNEEK